MDNVTIEETAEYAAYEAYQDARDEAGEDWISFEIFEVMFAPKVAVAEVIEEDDIPF